MQSSRNSTQGLSARPGNAIWNEESDAKLESLSDSAKFILISFSPATNQVNLQQILNSFPNNHRKSAKIALFHLTGAAHHRMVFIWKLQKPA